MAFLLANKVVILAALLGLSEVLAMFFPPSSGVAGVLQGLVKLVKFLGGKEPPQLP